MPKPSPPDPRHVLGAHAEDRAAAHLESLGYRILERNVRLKVGELDIVAEHEDDLVFVEVRARTDSNQVHPAETVTPRKQKQVVRCAMAYLQQHGIEDRMVRFDVVAVLEDKNLIEVYPAAFEAGR